MHTKNGWKTYVQGMTSSTAGSPLTNSALPVDSGDGATQISRLAGDPNVNW